MRLETKTVVIFKKDADAFSELLIQRSLLFNSGDAVKNSPANVRNWKAVASPHFLDCARCSCQHGLVQPGITANVRIRPALFVSDPTRPSRLGF